MTTKPKTARTRNAFGRKIIEESATNAFGRPQAAKEPPPARRVVPATESANATAGRLVTVFYDEGGKRKTAQVPASVLESAPPAPQRPMDAAAKRLGINLPRTTPAAESAPAASRGRRVINVTETTHPFLN